MIGAAQAIDVVDPVRTMAAQCAQCHGMEGNNSEGFDHLNGESYGELYDELIEMHNSSDEDLMHFQIKGYTLGQINDLAIYFAKQLKKDEEEDEEEDEEDD